MDDHLLDIKKMVEQYERETKECTIEQIWDDCGTRIIKYTEDFVRWLASRPTCGQEQRKFLDEVERNHADLDWQGKRELRLLQPLFKAKLKKVIKGE